MKNKFTINAAVFYTRVTNVQVPTLVLPDAVTITRNAGKLSSKGAEVELNAKLSGFTVEYNIGFTDAKFKNLNLAQNGSSVNLTGKRQLFTPKVTSMAALGYAYPVNKKKDVKILARAEWRYLDKHYFDLANTISQSPYSLINGRAGVITTGFEVFVWATNLANKKYIDYAYDFGAAHLGNPRTLGLTLRTNF